MEIKSTPQKMPRGIPYIIGNEIAERFSYYGMTSILIAFLAEDLNLGMDTASLYVHYFGFAIYFFPLVGAIIADMFLGKYKTIIIFSIVCCLGHLTLALFETSFIGSIIGLGLIALGVGGIKPCVSSHLGDQFSPQKSSLMERAYSYFYLAINFGGIVGGFLCPALRKANGVSIAFLIPAILMLIATISFWYGRKYFVSIPANKDELLRELKQKSTLSSLKKLCTLYTFLSIFFALFEQMKTTWVVQAHNPLLNKSLNFSGWTYDIIASQVQNANPFFILVFTPLISLLVYPTLKKWVKVNYLQKITAGFCFAALSFLVVGWIEDNLSIGIEMSIFWLIFAYFLLTIGEILVSVTALEISYKNSPSKLKSFVMSLFLLSVAAGNGIAAIVQSNLVEPITISKFSDTSQSSLIFKDASKLSKFDKIKLTGINIPKSASDTTKIDSGIFIIGEVRKNEVDLLTIETGKEFQLSSGSTISEIKAYRYILTGGSYFYAFSLLMGITILLFILKYKK